MLLCAETNCRAGRGGARVVAPLACARITRLFLALALVSGCATTKHDGQIGPVPTIESNVERAISVNDHGTIHACELLPLERALSFTVFSEKTVINGKAFYLDDREGGQQFVTLAPTTERDTLAVTRVRLPLSYRTLLTTHHLTEPRLDSIFFVNSASSEYWEPRLIKVIQRQGRTYEFVRLFTYTGQAEDGSWYLESFDFMLLDEQHMYYIDQSALFAMGMNYVLESSEPQEDNLIIGVHKQKESEYPTKPLFGVFSQGSDSTYRFSRFVSNQLPRCYDDVGDGYMNSHGPVHEGFMVGKVVPLVYRLDSAAHKDLSMLLTGKSSAEVLSSKGGLFLLCDFRQDDQVCSFIFNSEGKTYVVGVDNATSRILSRQQLEPEPMLDTPMFKSAHEIVGLSKDGKKLLKWCR